MTFYRVLVNGEQIELPDTDGGKPIIGFFASRAVRANTPDEAAERAKAIVLAKWADDKYQEGNRKGPPVLRIEKAERTSFVRYLTHPKRGFVFYAED